MTKMARICFHRGDAELGVAALQKAGYSVLTHVFDHEPDHVFVEAYRDAASDELLLDETSRVVDPFCGYVSDAGRPPAGHVPFEYETQVWRQ
jgi:hypothetical protein